MRIPPLGFRTKSQQETRDKSSAFAFDRVVNGAITYKNINKRDRGGKIPYTQVVEKIGGLSELAEASGKVGGVKGAVRWVDQDFENSNRVRFLFAAENAIYLYVVDTETLYFLRDVNTADSATLKFLSGWQQKNVMTMVIGDADETGVFTYSGTVNGLISAVGDNGSGKAQYTSAGHGLVDGNTVTITGCTDTAYNVTATISNVTTNTFDIETVTFTATDTGAWTGETLTKRATTDLDGGKYVGALDDRAVISGAEDNTDIAQYSTVEGTGVFTNFTDSTDVDGGGVLSGSLGAIQALYFHKGFGYTFEKNRIVPHRITNYDVSGTGRLKDRITVVESAIVDGVGVESPKAVTDKDDNLYIFNNEGFYGYTIQGGLRDMTKGIRPLFGGYNVSNSSLIADSKKNRLIATCRSSDGVADDTHLIYSLDDPSLQFVDGKYTNQLIYDDVSERIFGFSSIEPKIVEVYSDESYVDNEDPIEIRAETRMYNMGDMYKNKIFCNFSCKVGAVNLEQVFTVNIYVDDNSEPSTTFTKSMRDVIEETGEGMSVWGSDDVWGAGESSTGEVGYATILWEGFVPHFEKMSIEVVEQSPYYCVIHQPVIRYITTNEKINSFDNTQTND